MITENVECEFIGFDPEYEIKNYVAKVIDKLYNSAPSDSGIKLAFQKSHQLMKATCRIASQVGTFVAEAKGINPILTIQSLENQIKDQLESWKSNRFEKVS